jgi:tRNA A-37 threonylcarbamoyl transferase component Bud32
MTSCPDEHRLLQVATGEPDGESIQDHLDDCPACRGRMKRLRAELSAVRRALGDGAAAEPIGPGPEEQPPGAELTGGRPERPVAIGQYLVVELLDEGGEAEVYRVLHPHLGKEMVLKWARRPVGDAERASLFAEVRVLVELEHINLVRVFDSGEHDGRPFLVMEYLRGRNLEVYAHDERVTPRRAARLVARLARALALVHRKNVIHRDIKPRNILIDEAGEPRLIDFGLARMRSAWSDPFAATWGGTLPYMPPEQARREHDRTGPRSDLFGLGAVLYFLLTGRPPFVGKARDEVWDHARRCEFDAGALRAARVPRRLERICLKALAADPDDRYATAEELGRALNGFLRRPALLAAGTAILLVAAILARVVSGTAGHPTLQPTIEVLRGDEVIKDLKGALPLRTGDQLRVRCAVPARSRVLAFWYDSEGRLAELGPLAITRGWHVDQVVYPRPDPGRDVVPLEGAPGTEFLLICARSRGEPSAAEVRPLFAGLGRLAGLGPQTYLLLDGESVQAHGIRGLGAPEPRRVGDACARLEDVRQQLRERFEFVAGLAIPHADAGHERAAEGSRPTRPLPAADRASDPK